MLYVRATDPKILAAGQDGGMVSALLLHHFKTGRLGAESLYSGSSKIVDLHQSEFERN